jgi:hypothetical protein
MIAFARCHASAAERHYFADIYCLMLLPAVCFSCIIYFDIFISLTLILTPLLRLPLIRSVTLSLSSAS